MTGAKYYRTISIAIKMETKLRVCHNYITCSQLCGFSFTISHTFRDLFNALSGIDAQCWQKLGSIIG